jgi:hypothetical protein
MFTSAYIDKIDNYSIYLQQDLIREKLKDLKSTHSLTIVEITEKIESIERLINTSGVTPYDDSELRNKINIIEAVVIDIRNKLNIQLKNNVYYDEYFVPDYLIDNIDKFTLPELVEKIDSLSSLISIPFLSSKVFDLIKSVCSESDKNKLTKAIDYYGKLVLKNRNTLNAWKHYTIFWLFNNIDLTKSYPTPSIITELIIGDLQTLIITCQSLNQNLNFISLITEIQKVTPSFSVVKNYLDNITFTEENKKQMILYMNMCLVQESIITLPSLSDLNTFFIEIFLEITNRNHHDKSPEDYIHVFN